eukprot:gnl/TRDRNA2_/TRDRNA2_131424_c1_seq1.p1 gnl/TRDRNA2_/TRDRNA2_131424_c1~~gnl/TRDRNA2_/TRDRNA2_131424_c1_seq1.p1  ORF type:complete len:205 (+),score=29.25 gnl/TRDRNA2_/TRDRNA2_131424_c1_seq1:58-615(+)
MAPIAKEEQREEATWWRAEGTLAVRETPDGAAERVSEFHSGDAVRVIGQPDDEWLQVDLDGALRFDDNRPSSEEPSVASIAKVGFVRRRNRFRALLVPAPEAAAAAEQWARQCRDRSGGLCWFRPPPRTAQVAAAYQRPLLLGGLEELERREELQVAAREILADQPILTSPCPALRPRRFVTERE